METGTDMQGGSHHGAGLHAASRDGKALFPLSLLFAASGRPKEDVAADSFVHLDLIFTLLPYTNQLHLMV